MAEKLAMVKPRRALAPAPGRHIDQYSFTVTIPPVDPNAPPVRRPPSSKTVARLKERAEAAARDVAAARSLRAQVQPRLRSPPGKLFDVDAGALVLRGPAGGIGTSQRVAETLAPLSKGGRHPAAALVAAGGWADECALREALQAIAPKLAAVGLRVCRRKAGLRMARVGSRQERAPRHKSTP